MNDPIESIASTHAKTAPTVTPREHLLWLLRYEQHLLPTEILALRWRDLDQRAQADDALAAGIVAYRHSLGAKSFLTHPDAPAFVSRNRGRGGRHVAINRWQLNHLLRKVRIGA